MKTINSKKFNQKAEKASSSEKISIYTHFPWCKKRCHFCDFTVFTNKTEVEKDLYLSCLIKELKMWKKALGDVSLATLYLGGGTPSLIKLDSLQKYLEIIFTEFRTDKNLEVTIEIEPDDLTSKKLQAYLSMGINRFSLGVQTFKQEQLDRLGRTHTVKESLNALELLSPYNLSADILFGLHKQTLNDYKKDLKNLLLFPVNHISLYNLTLPKNHFLNKNRPESETEVQMIQQGENLLKEHGIHPYEISNFARDSYESKHNLAYWNQENVIGIGVSAHSHLKPKLAQSLLGKKLDFGLRFWNSKSLKTYYEQLSTPHLKPLFYLPDSQKEELKIHEALTDFFHTKLRKQNGFSIKEALSLIKNSEGEKLLDSKLNKLKKEGLINQKNQRFFLSQKGKVLSNQVFLGLTVLEKESNFFIRKD